VRRGERGGVFGSVEKRMKADFQSYKRAAAVCLLGLVIQLAMGLALLIYGVVAKDQAGISAAFFALLGSVVWLALAVVFDQHRRERIEALEAESLSAQGARAASAFGQSGDELRVAAKRLVGMHRIFLPVVSLVLAAALIAVGLWRLEGGRDFFERPKFEPPVLEAGWRIVIGAVIAVLGFLFARFVAGMAKQPVWANLRAGAAIAVGAALAGAALAIGHTIDYFGTDSVASVMHMAIPIVMIVIGAEIVFNFLLGIYRPRRPGEVPRPAMDSRVLGFAAAPDRIAESIGGALNYQFGFDVTGSWFYQLLSRSIAALVVVGVLVLWALTCVAVVQPNEQGLRVRFGQNMTEARALRPGPYVKLPWPFERIDRFQTERLRRVNLGGEAPTIKTAVLWTNDHKAAERVFIVQPEALEREAGQLDAGDRSLIAAEVPLYYIVEELALFNGMAAPEDRERVIKVEGQRELMRYMATRGADELLGAGRAGAAAELERRMTERFKGNGIRVVSVGIEGIHPPRETAEKFEEVVSAGQRREGAIENGYKEADQMLIEAAGSLGRARELVAVINRHEREPDPAQQRLLDAQIADLMAKAGGAAAIELLSARRERWEKHMHARARAEQHKGEIAKYEASPTVYVARKYFDMLRDLIANKRVYIVADGAQGVEVRVDLHDSAIGGNLFEDPKATAPEQSP